MKSAHVDLLSGFVEISFGDEDYGEWCDETLDEFSDWLQLEKPWRGTGDGRILNV